MYNVEATLPEGAEVRCGSRLMKGSGVAELRQSKESHRDRTRMEIAEDLACVEEVICHHRFSYPGFRGSGSIGQRCDKHAGLAFPVQALGHGRTGREQQPYGSRCQEGPAGPLTNTQVTVFHRHRCALTFS